MNKKIFASLLLGFGGTLAVLVAVAMPPGSWAVVVGVFLGLLGCIPVMLVVMFANRRRNEDIGQPPVYIVQQPQPVYGYYEQPQPQYFQPQPQEYAPQFEEYYEEYAPMIQPPVQAPRPRRQPRRPNNSSLLMPTRKPLPSARRRTQPQYEQTQQYYEPQYYAEPEYYEPQLEYPSQEYYEPQQYEQDYYAPPPRRSQRLSQLPRREQSQPDRYGYTDAVDADFRTIGE